MPAEEEVTTYGGQQVGGGVGLVLLILIIWLIFGRRRGRQGSCPVQWASIRRMWDRRKARSSDSVALFEKNIFVTIAGVAALNRGGAATRMSLRDFPAAQGVRNYMFVER